ncbi:facilitated trehalose transporter Tret1-like [Hyposmocoma kahamanoa]|uniref:facilitated trehalose transporter Tret1-like n=1 Tax=Hyposmocoma kahamanoa TaxID=1477025 RepID=UPI000E6D6053|nr:facilitated trehalose transporter Tret1-like [Hyposmocoma kahamanoa]
MAEKVTVAAFFMQILCTLAISGLIALIGFVYAWPSYNIENFESNSTVLSWPLTTFEKSLLGSLTNIGALLLTPTCGYALNIFGRRYSAMLFGLPMIIGWTIISLTNYTPLIILAMGISGFGAAGQAVTSVYIAEIVQDSIRGMLTSSCVTIFFAGLLFSYAIGGYLTYQQVIYVHLTGSCLYIAVLGLLKESPVYLVQKGREEDAKRSIAFYRRVDVTSKEVEVEIKKIKLQLDPRIDEILHGETEGKLLLNGVKRVYHLHVLDITVMDENIFLVEPHEKELLDKKLQPVEEVKSVSQWQFLKNSESSKRALMMALIIMTANIMMGGIVLQVYAEPMFKEAVPSMHPNTCAILLAVDLMVASFICASVVDKFGRRFLMTTSAIATGICTLLLASQLHLGYGPYWYTAFLIYAYCFVYNLGAATVPYIMSAEMFLPEVRGLCNSMVMACMWISNFVTLIIFNPMVDSFGLGPLFYFFTIICISTAIYSHFCLVETKGLSADQIQLLFLKKNKKENIKV